MARKPSRRPIDGLGRELDAAIAGLEQGIRVADARLVVNILEAAHVLGLTRRLAPEAWDETVAEVCGGNHRLADYILAFPSRDPATVGVGDGGGVPGGFRFNLTINLE